MPTAASCGPSCERRFDYGTSEGLLKQLHPGRGKKMALPAVLTIVLGLLVGALVARSLLPLPVAAVVLLADTVLATRKFRAQQLPFSALQILLARLRAVGSLGYYLGYHLLRYYLPVQLLAACVYPPLGLVTLVMLLGAGAVDWGVRRPKMPLPAFCFYYFLEQLAYGSGVFRGCLEMKSFSCYRLNLQDAGASA